MSRKNRSKESVAKSDARRVAFKQRRKIDAVEYKGGMCNDCKGIFHPCVFDFHHLDPALKSGTSSKLMNWSWDRLKVELDNCILLCSNCHRLHHYGKPQNKYRKTMSDYEKIDATPAMTSVELFNKIAAKSETKKDEAPIAPTETPAA